MKTVTFDETEWQVVPKKATAEMVGTLKRCLTITCRGGILRAGVALDSAIAAAPQPPAVSAEPVEGNWIAAEDVKRLAREMDVAINGESGAARSPSLCDVAAKVIKLFKSAEPVAEVRVSDGVFRVHWLSCPPDDGVKLYLSPPSAGGSFCDNGVVEDEDGNEWPCPCQNTVSADAKGAALHEIAKYFESGNRVPVERATIKASDFWRIYNAAMQKGTEK